MYIYICVYIHTLQIKKFHKFLYQVRLIYQFHTNYSKFTFLFFSFGCSSLFSSLISQIYFKNLSKYNLLKLLIKCKKLTYSLISLIIFKYIIDEILNNFFLYILSSTLISRLISRYLQKTMPYKKKCYYTIYYS